MLLRELIEVHWTWEGIRYTTCFPPIIIHYCLFPFPSIAYPNHSNLPAGIGLGIADCCLANGASCVYSIDIGETGDEFAAVASTYPNKLFALQADVTKEESIQAAVDRIVSEAGAIHGMVCNAGRTKHKPALEFTTEEIDQLWGVNVSRGPETGYRGEALTRSSYTDRSTRREWRPGRSSS